MENIEQQGKPIEVEISTERDLIIPSKTNARAFHESMRQRIMENGYGMLEYIEMLKFFEKVKEVIYGDSSQYASPEAKAGDKIFKDMILEEVQKGGKAGITSKRGTKFSVMENAGTVYHYENCGDPILSNLQLQLEEIKFKVKERQDFIKTVPANGLEIRHGDELITIYPPYKTSTTTFKVTLPK